jgi:polyisoprenoid-binding protein YceI
MAWTLDKAHSQIGFAVKHMMISTVRGQFKDFDAKLEIDDKDLTHSYIDGWVKTASVDTQDTRRDDHLRSPDFFDTDKYSTMTFKSTRIEKKDEDRYHVTGNLTIKEVTREVTFDVTEEGRGKDPWGKQHIGFSGQLAINRHDFGLNWNVALEAGGWLVHEQVKVIVDLEVVESQEAPATATTTETAKAS